MVMRDDNIPVRALVWLHGAILNKRATADDLIECMAFLIERSFEQGAKHSISSVNALFDCAEAP